MRSNNRIHMHSMQDVRNYWTSKLCHGKTESSRQRQGCSKQILPSSAWMRAAPRNYSAYCVSNGVKLINKIGYDAFVHTRHTTIHLVCTTSQRVPHHLLPVPLRSRATRNLWHQGIDEVSLCDALFDPSLNKLHMFYNISPR